MEGGVCVKEGAITSSIYFYFTLTKKMCWAQPFMPIPTYLFIYYYYYYYYDWAKVGTGLE